MRREKNKVKAGRLRGLVGGVPREQMEGREGGLRAPHTSVSKAAVNFAEKDGQGRGCSWTCWVCWGLGQLIVIETQQLDIGQSDLGPRCADLQLHSADTTLHSGNALCGHSLNPMCCPAAPWEPHSFASSKGET